MSYLRFESLTKAFPGVRALDDVSFDVAEGSVHALCGENGAGKSTLLKILSGVYNQDAGEVSLGGEVTGYASPQGAIDSGIAVIYQELHLVPEMTVAENVFLGHLPQKAGWVNRRLLAEKTRAQLAMLGVSIDPWARVGSLPIALRQIVEIAKALSHDAKVIAFDEPTSSLSEREVEHLFSLIRDLRQQGKVILYVSHRMAEIFSVCDAATVLRDGKHVETFSSLEGITADDIVSRMVGRSLEDIYGYRPRIAGESALKVESLEAPGLTKPVDLEVRTGEIVGIFGLAGAGRSELLHAIYGAAKKDGGNVSVFGVTARLDSPAKAIRSGLMLCPEDRKKDGVFALRSVNENINISVRRKYSRMGFWVDGRKERGNAQFQVDRLSVKTPSLDQPIGLLSGGNQQKAILGRWLSEEVRVLMLDEPTRGIDVGAKREIYEIIYGLAESGVGILIVSSELPEVLGVCDRILVMREGQLVGDVPRAEATQEKIIRLALPQAIEADL
ncbi:MAG: L-arabinose ABC transporter ATP-binding protein AraG [Armatimonadota bacterium]|nr:L-arabinose ABC transporter ATP-binding protein AraG [Armatimonadota bacterium]